LGGTVGPGARVAPLRILLGQFASPIVVLLAAAAALSLAVGERTDGSIILGILLASGLLGFWQEHRAGDAVARLLSTVRTTATVRRDGAEREVPLDEVVPGDVVLLRAGTTVPGDALLLESRDLYVDEAALTGESFPAGKVAGTVAADAALARRSGAVVLGTHVVSGLATAVVVRTGARTEFGAIAHRLALRPAETEFEHGVRRFGYLLLYVAATLALVILAVNVALRRPVLDSLLFTLALAVGLTPQLLPAIVSVTLAHGARAMARAHVIVRRLGAIEDLGGMQILCTDKTGTLTEGVVGVHAATDWRGAPCDAVRRYAYVNAGLASGFANPIDAALRAAPAADLAAYEKVDEVPYDFVRKRVSVAVVHEGQRLLVTKGALAPLLDVCTTAEDADGTRRPLAEARAAILERYEALSRDGHRCLGVAVGALAGDAPVRRECERDLAFVGLLSLDDPLKPGAAAALAELAALGVRTKLITGDNRHVAARVAADTGIDGGGLLTGQALRTMSPAALVAAAPRTAVFAEVEPNQKEHIIHALRTAGHSVGFLGDGINDAAALHAADVGISVDSATDVTRQAADVVLLRKELGVLGDGVREGRRAFANTLKYVFITTSANFGNMLSMAVASLATPFLPMLPKQILLLNGLTDLPAMAIATDRLDAELVATPRRWSNRRIRRFMLSFGVVSSAFDVLTFGALLALHVPAARFRTGWFLESVLSELCVLLVIRTQRTAFRSAPGRALLWASVAVAAITLALPYLPVGAALGFAPLSGGLLALVGGIVAAYVAASELVKRAVARGGLFT
jgi:Mg2+-importing ATPase